MSNRAAAADTVSFGPFRLTAAERLLSRDGAPVAIGGRALDLLIALTDRAGQVVSRRELLGLVWPDVIVDEASLRVSIAGIRKALGEGKDGHRYVVNVTGRGYSFVAPVQRAADCEGPAADDARQRLPALPAFFVGRDKTVADVSSLLLAHRFGSVIGPGGIGKTSVALAVAHGLSQQFGDDAVCFVDLGSLTNAADVPSAVASALGCIVQGHDPEPYILAYLADKRRLIVLDNCEHVIDVAAPLGERLFRGAPLVHLLATSREALRVDDENQHLIVPLESPRNETPSAAEALASPAVQLFMKKAASSGYAGELSDSDAPIVANMCRRLDGLALAIELVASHVGTYGVGGTADLLDSGAELFLLGRRNAVPRQQTLNATLDWSFKLLAGDERKVLSRLSMFVGQFTLAAAQFVAADAGGEPHAVTHTIASLADKSLISLTTAGGGATYRLADTTRAYAAARLAESGETEMIARRHADYFAGFLKDATAETSAFIGRSGATSALHMGNIRKALAWSFSSAGDIAIGIDLAARATPLFLEVSLFSECQQWCQRAAEQLPETDRGTRRELEIQEALARSSMYTLGKIGTVEAALERGLELAEKFHDGRRQLNLLADLNVHLTRVGDFEGTLKIAKRNAALAAKIGGPAEKVLAEWMLGTCYHLTGDQAAALRHSELGFELAATVANTPFDLFYETRALVTLARALWLSGFPERASLVSLETIDEMAQYGHHLSYCAALVHATPVLLWSGDYAGAAEPIERALAQASKYSLPTFHNLALALKGDLMLATGKTSLGVEILRGALEAMVAGGYFIASSMTARALAEGLVLSGRPDEALITIDDAIRRAERVHELSWQPDLLRTRGEILLALPRPDLAAAEETLLRAIDAARKQAALSWELKATLPLARLWSQQARSKEARHMLDKVYRRFTEGFDTPDLVSARKLLDAFGSAA